MDARRPVGQDAGVLVRIEASDLPGRACGPDPDVPGGHRNVHVGVQGKRAPDRVLGLVSGGAASAQWSLDCDVTRSTTGVDFKGPCIQGPPGGRFIYLSWGDVDDAGSFSMFRRAKLRLDAIPLDVVAAASAAGVLVARLGLTDKKGQPVCASIVPPRIEWSAEHGPEVLTSSA